MGFINPRINLLLSIYLGIVYTTGKNVDLGDVLFLGLPHETKCKGFFLACIHSMSKFFLEVFP